MLFEFNKEGLLLTKKDRNYIFFYANKNNKVFIDLSRIYWAYVLGDLIDSLEKFLISPVIILFGSLSKAEAKADSDIDLCILAHKKEINLKDFEKKLKRKIQMFFFKSIKDINNPELASNIINGYALKGRLKLNGF